MNYNIGDVDIEFKTNRIFLLMQCLYRIDDLENKINSKNSNLEKLSYDFQEFKNLIEKNKQGLSKFNRYKENAENNNMWAEYGEFIKSFAQEDIDILKGKNPQIANAIEELMNSKFFLSLEKINNEYSSEIEEKFINSTKNYKYEAENIVGKTDTKKIIYKPFSPKFFDIEPCCLSDKNGNKEYAVEFTIPTNKEEFEKSFGMEYTEGIESVILFHEKLHADIPTKDERFFKNHMQKELDSHLKHTIIELLSNGEMGVDIAGHESCFSSVFHTGKIYNGKNLLKTKELKEFGIKDNELLHIEAKELNGEKIENYSKDDMGIIKIRALVYPYVLMYKNRNNDNQLKLVTDEIRRDSKMIKEIYGEEFLSKIMDIEFLNETKKNVEPYKNLLDFAEGMSKELLGIEQLKDKRKEFIDSLKGTNYIEEYKEENENQEFIQINENEHNIENEL